MLTDIPQELQYLKRWVGAANDSKAPLKCIPDDGVSRQAASTSNENTWLSFNDAMTGFSLGYIDYLGFVFNADDGYIGIDIDDGKDDFGLTNDLAWDIISHCKSYTEESKSGRGYHIILKGNLPFLGKNNRNGVEIYKGGRYFIMTGKNCFHKDIIVNQEAIDYVIEKYFPEYRPTKENEKQEKTRFYSAEFEKPNKGKISLKQTYPDIKQGTRNLSLLSLCGQFKAQGLDKGEVYRKLLKINQEHCKPPLSTNEIESIVDSGFKYK